MDSRASDLEEGGLPEGELTLRDLPGIGVIDVIPWDPGPFKTRLANGQYNFQAGATFASKLPKGISIQPLAPHFQRPKVLLLL